MHGITRRRSHARSGAGRGESHRSPSRGDHQNLCDYRDVARGRLPRRESSRSLEWRWRFGLHVTLGGVVVFARNIATSATVLDRPKGCAVLDRTGPEAKACAFLLRAPPRPSRSSRCFAEAIHPRSGSHFHHRDAGKDPWMSPIGSSSPLQRVRLVDRVLDR